MDGFVTAVDMRLHDVDAVSGRRRRCGRGWGGVAVGVVFDG